MNKTVRTNDTNIYVSSQVNEMDKRKWFNRPDYENYNRSLKFLSEMGFSLGKDPDLAKRAKCLLKHNDEGRKGNLEFKSECYPTGFKFEFFQNIVTVNRNGGFYDFDKRKKMPYLIRKSFELTCTKLIEFLSDRGFSIEPQKPESWLADPLAYFNSGWTADRFERGPDGWPCDKELNCWSGKDADGNILSNGDVRYARNSKGYLVRGRVYGGINGMWCLVYGPTWEEVINQNASFFFSCDPTAVPRKDWAASRGGLAAALRRLEDKKTEAIKIDDLETALRIKRALERMKLRNENTKSAEK